MNLDELRSVRATERRTDSLQQLRDSFYEDVATYIADLKRRREERAAAVQDPFADTEIRRLSDEIETAEEVAEAIYERRIGKVVSLASFAAAETTVETEGMTEEEAELFEDLVDRISQNKADVLDVLESGGNGAETLSDVSTGSTVTSDTPSSKTRTGTTPDAGGGAPAEPLGRSEEGQISAQGNDPESTETDSETEPDDLLADAMGPGGSNPPSSSGPGTQPAESERSPGEGPDPTGARTPGTESDGKSSRSSPGDDDGSTPDRQTVRITQDIGAIYGTDEREYELEAEDVVRLPVANATPLVERDAAEPLE